MNIWLALTALVPVAGALALGAIVAASTRGGQGRGEI